MKNISYLIQFLFAKIIYNFLILSGCSIASTEISHASNAIGYKNFYEKNNNMTYNLMPVTHFRPNTNTLPNATYKKNSYHHKNGISDDEYIKLMENTMCTDNICLVTHNNLTSPTVETANAITRIFSGIFGVFISG